MPALKNSWNGLRKSPQKTSKLTHLKQQVLSLIQHKNVQVRFDQQVENSENYVLPFIEGTHTINAATRVMEVDCAEGGVLLPFLQSNQQVIIYNISIAV